MLPAKGEAVAAGAALGTHLTKVGVVLDTGSGSDFDAGRVESFSPIFCAENGRIAGLYTGYNSAVTEAALGIAWSDDGLNWEKGGVVFGKSGVSGTPDRYGTTGPRIFFDGSLYHLWYIGLDAAGYEGGTPRLCYATTPSLTEPSWTRHGAVLSPGGSGWRQRKVYRASPPVFHNGLWYLFVNAADVNLKETIGCATASSLSGPWTWQESEEPILGNVGGSDITGDPFVRKVPGGYRMDFFRAVNNTWTRDYFATTTDEAFPGGWVEGNGGAAIVAPSMPYDAKYAGKPDLLPLGGRLFHYYVAVASNDHRCIALAVDPPFSARPDFSSSTGVTGLTTASRLQAVEQILRGFGLPVASTLVMEDAFTRANGAPGNTELGGFAYSTGGGSGFAISSNDLVWSGTTDGQIAVNAGLADNWEMRVALGSITGQYPISLFYGSSATSFVKLVRDQTGNIWFLRDSTVGAGSQVNKSVTTDLASNDVIRVRKQGSTVTLFVNDVQIAEWTGYSYHNTSADTFVGIAGSANLALVVKEWSLAAV